MPEKWIGKIVEIVYVDRSGKITQRKIEVKGVHGNMVKATCLMTGAPRSFCLDRILAWQPATKTA